MSRPSSSFERLVVRLEAAYGRSFPRMRFFRTYAGSIQRSQGAWSWYATDHEGREVLASHWSLTELLKSKGLLLSPKPYEPGVLEVDPLQD